VDTSKERIEHAARAWAAMDATPGLGPVPGDTERIPLPTRMKISADKADF